VNAHLMHTKLTVALTATAALAVTLLATTDAHAFFHTSAELFAVAGGSSTTDVTSTLGGMEQTPQALDRDDSSGIGLTLWGVFNVIPYAGAGLAIHYIPGLEYSDQDRTTHEYGSELDLNAMITGTIPIPVVQLTLFAEGGLTAISLSDTFVADNNLELLGDNNASTFGWNAGGGVKVGYSFVPMIGVHLGLAYQLYSAPLFDGGRTIDIGDENSTVDLSGSRIRLDFGVDVNFL